MVVAVGTVFLAVNGEEDAMFVEAGVVWVLVVPVVTSPSDVAVVEFLRAASCRTGNTAVLIVPVVGPAIDCSLLWHLGIWFEREVALK